MIATTPGLDYKNIGIYNEPKLKRASKVLQEKGIKKDYVIS